MINSEFIMLICAFIGTCIAVGTLSALLIVLFSVLISSIKIEIKR